MKKNIVSATVYKLCDAAAWAAAVECGWFVGSADDVLDGFIHLSTAAQVAETARRYFSNTTDLRLAAFDTANLGDELRWEPSRGRALFPHLYAPLPTRKALWVKAIALGTDGVPIIPEGIE